MARRDSNGEWESVISPIPVDHPAGKVTYDGWGIYINGHGYVRHLATYLPRTALTKTGRVAKKQPKKAAKQPYTWWKAQCILRGISPKGTMAQLQERLEGHEDTPMADEFRALEEQAKIEYRAKNNQAVEDKWVREMTDEEKMSTDLRRYLTETFLAGATSPEAVVVQGGLNSGQRWALRVQNLARDLGLAARIVEVTPDPDELFEVEDRRWVVVGPKKAGVAKAAQPVMETTEKRKVEKHRRQDAVMAREQAIADQQQQELRAALDACEDWDVTGTYKISCPFIEEEWESLKYSSGQEDLTLTVYCKETPKGPQMYAKFDFLVHTGVMRFERHKRDNAPVLPRPDVNKKRKRQRDSDDEGDDEDERDSDEERDSEDELDDFGEPRRSPTPEAFYLGSITHPSAECRTWNYRWRGEETGTGEILLYEDQNVYEIKWYGPQVERLKGKIGSTHFRPCTFTGVKVGVGAELEEIEIAEEWANRNEHAHYLASRW